MLVNKSEWKKKSITEIEEEVKRIYSSMIEFQKKADYVSAQTYREGFQSGSEYLRERKVQETEDRHRRQSNELQSCRKNQLMQSNKQWNRKLEEYDQECKKLINQMKSKNEKEQMAKRLQMEQELSTTVKESNQLLNLRKMQAHAAKQKNFVEAHSIQQKVNKVYAQEKEAWMQARQNKIQINLKNMRNRQDAEMDGTNRKIKLTLEDYAKQRHLETIGINQKFDNFAKQMKAQHERQILSLFKELKNLGGQSPLKKVRKSPENGVKSRPKIVQN